MKKENVIYLRDTLKGQLSDAKLRVTCDNMIFFNESQDVVNWDDEKGIVTVIKHSDDYAREANGEFEIITTEYELIQFITLDCGRLSVKRIANALGFGEVEMSEADKLIYDATHINL